MTFTIGIAGITGQMAVELCGYLLQNPDIHIRGYCRDPTKVLSRLSSSPQIEIMKGGAFDRETVYAFTRGCDIVVCCYQGTDELMISGQKLLIDACEDEGVPRYMASDWALFYDNLEFGQLFTKDPMKHVKAYLGTKKKVKGVHVLNAIFMDTLFSPYFKVYSAETHTFQHWGPEDAIFEGTSYENAAEYTARAILDKGAVGTLRFLGDRKTMDEISRSYEKVYGIKPKVLIQGTADELYQKMWALRKQYPNEPYRYMAMFYHYYTVTTQTALGPDTDNSRYPDIQPTTYEIYFQKTPLEELPHKYVNAVDMRLENELKH